VRVERKIVSKSMDQSPVSDGYFSVMKYRADINVMPLKELLDPQGKAVLHGLDSLNLRNVSNVRIGKHIMVELEANGEDEARQQVETACKKLLANPVMEYFEFNLTPIEESVSA